MALWTRSKSEAGKSEGVSLDDHELVDRAAYLRALEQMRVNSQAEYRCVLDYHRQQLSRAYKVNMFAVAHPRDFIANVAIAKDVKIRTLIALVDDMERTVDKLAVPEPTEDTDPTPIGV